MAEEKTEGKDKSGLLQIVNLALMVVMLALGGFIAWKLMQLEQMPQAQAQLPAKNEQPVPEAEDESEAPPVMMDLDNITVNLADTDESRFLRAKIKLEVRGEEAKAKVSNNLPKINDLLITVLSGKTFAEIRTPEGKYALKEDLIYRINRLIGGKPVKNLYFTDFVSQ